MLTRERNKVVYMHFIMSVLVILIHSINNTTKFQKFFSIDTGIGQFAVPLFFMLSGFLFFRNVEYIEDVKRKIKKRVNTILVPYLLWNLIYYCIHLLIKPGSLFSFTDIIDAAFNYTYNPSFWFMYQLILLIVLSLVIYYFQRKSYHVLILIILVSAAIAYKFDLPFVNEDALIYYSAGALFNRLYTEQKAYFIERKYIIPALLIAIFFFLLNRIMYSVAGNNISYVSFFTLSVVYVRLAVGFFIFYLCDLFFRYYHVPGFMNNTFLLYAIHYMIVKGLIIIMKFFMYKFLLAIYYDIVENIVFILSPIICVVINYYFSLFLSKNMPKAYKLLSGDRT